MDYDQVARFLSSCTTPGFRRSLSMSPQDTLARCGFHPGETGQLAASLAKLRSGSSSEEYIKQSQTYQKITRSFKQSNKSWGDDCNA